MSFQAFVNMYFGEEISVEDLGDNLDFLREEYYDMMTWLCMQTGYIAVWNDRFACYGGLTGKQRSKLKALKLAGLYRGNILKTAIF